MIRLFLILLFVPVFAFAQSNSPVTYKGYLYQQKAKDPFPMDLTLSFNKSELSGISEIMLPYKLVGFSVKGSINYSDQNPTSISFTDEAMTTSIGDGIWCRKSYIGNIEYRTDSIIISGPWENTERDMFEYGKLVKNSRYDCYPGTFRVAIAKKNLPSQNATNKAEQSMNDCLSGDCVNGKGKMILPLGEYSGDFKNGLPDGKGTLIFSNDADRKMYKGEFREGEITGFGKLFYNENASVFVVSSGGENFEGYFYKGFRKGQGKLTGKNGSYLSGNWSDYLLNGPGVWYEPGKIPIISFYENNLPNRTKRVPLEKIKYHQDTVFSKLSKCNCLTKEVVTVKANGFGNKEYEYVDLAGNVVGRGSELGIVDRSYQTNGLVNRTKHTVYIRCYRKFMFTGRDYFEYSDESYALEPGKMVFLDYKIINPPMGELLFASYTSDDLIFVGQYCDKKNSPCK